MMQSVALTESCFAHDDDFVVVEPLLGAAHNADDDDDSYDYCDDVFDTPSLLQASYEEAMHWTTPSTLMEESFPQMLEAASSLLLNSIADSPTHSVEILSTKITDFAEWSNHRDDFKMQMQLGGSENALGSEASSPCGFPIVSDGTIDFTKGSPGLKVEHSQSPMIDGKNSEAEPEDAPGSLNSTDFCDETLQEATNNFLPREAKSRPDYFTLESNAEETSSLPDAEEDALLAMAEEAESRSWPSRSKQRRLTNKKRRKQTKMARKAAAAAAAIVAHRSISSPRHSNKQRIVPNAAYQIAVQPTKLGD